MTMTIQNLLIALIKLKRFNQSKMQLKMVRNESYLRWQQVLVRLERYFTNVSSFKHKRARRILYLVDRNSLGKQTANAIKDNKIGTMSISSIYGLKELGDKVPDSSTKIQIATVQGMIKRLFFSDDDSEKPSVGAI
jgi:hypothetical protein